MKIHAIRSTKLLAITAVTALASGCAATAPTHAITPEPAPPLVVTADVGTALATASAPASPTPAPAPPPTPTTLEVAHVAPASDAMHPEPLDDQHAGEGLLKLREELFNSGFHGSTAVEARFRPLCDGQGYPVVGNVFRKASGYQPSAYCNNLRATHSSDSPKR